MNRTNSIENLPFWWLCESIKTEKLSPDLEDFLFLLFSRWNLHFWQIYYGCKVGIMCGLVLTCFIVPFLFLLFLVFVFNFHHTFLSFDIFSKYFFIENLFF